MSFSLTLSFYARFFPGATEWRSVHIVRGCLPGTGRIGSVEP